MSDIELLISFCRWAFYRPPWYNAVSFLSPFPFSFLCFSCHPSRLGKSCQMESLSHSNSQTRSQPGLPMHLSLLSIQLVKKGGQEKIYKIDAGSVPSVSTGTVWPQPGSWWYCFWKDSVCPPPLPKEEQIHVNACYFKPRANRDLVQTLPDPTCHMEQNKRSTKHRASDSFGWSITHPAVKASEGICRMGGSVPFHLYCITWDPRWILDAATDMLGISLILLHWLELTYAWWVL